MHEQLINYMTDSHLMRLLPPMVMLVYIGIIFMAVGVAFVYGRLGARAGAVRRGEGTNGFLLGVIAGILSFILGFVIIFGAVIAKTEDNHARDHLGDVLTQELTEKYELADVDGSIDWDTAYQLYENDWAHRAQVTVQLESGNSATYDVGFNEDSELTLYVPQDDTTLPNPENLLKGD